MADPELPALTPLEGGWSGETHLASYGDEEVVVRIYGDRSAWRGPSAPEVDAAVLALVRGLLPVPEVLEVRRPDPAGNPGLLVTRKLPGERLDLVLPGLDDAGLARIGREVGTLLGRLGHVAMPRAGLFTDRDLALGEAPPDLPEWVEQHSPALPWSPADHAALADLATRAQTLLDTDPRRCLVHSDFNPKNLLVAPGTLAITGLLDWEFAHAGSPYADLGNALRFERRPAYAEAVLTGYAAFMPSVPEDLLDRARAADLVALVELAGRRNANPVAARAHDLLLAAVRAGDWHVEP